MVIVSLSIKAMDNQASKSERRRSTTIISASLVDGGIVYSLKNISKERV